ncbi:hypothetical protein [Paraburkholderia phenazinium]|jgi:hypothetical protein|uniref:Lipoprotein n=1 Tax=Paraburkholderia phenazinium TaxID=60549 RepID=A0A1G8MAQ8_9BURK|nr:hypothetical protein [Paraburkholderia phenazinium]SDI65028.1 hypothetical protein SAMN05216466_1296 [Paraburkholderia phenazinium]
MIGFALMAFAFFLSLSACFQDGRCRVFAVGQYACCSSMFGTCENPREWRYTCGFDEEKERRLIEMLAYRDVHKAQNFFDGRSGE